MEIIASTQSRQHFLSGIDKPESGKPESGKPESGKPESGKPESGKPESGKPGPREHKAAVQGEDGGTYCKPHCKCRGRTYSERTFANMRRFPFSMNIDESTSNNNKKVLSMLVRYYHDDLRKVMVEHLGSLEILRVDAASLEKVLCDFFVKNNIPWQNLVSLLMDSCAVMRGSKTGLETRIQQHCPNLLDVDGDSCHHIHNAAKKFSEGFDGYLERVFSDLQVDHQWSPDQVMYLKEVAMILNLPVSSPQRGFVNHRWLSAYDASMATHAMMPAYQVLYYGFLSTADKELYKEPLESIFTKHNVNQTARARGEVVQDKLAKKGMTPQGRERKKRICQKLWHEETTTVLQLSLYKGVLAILKDYVMIFQGSQTLVHKLHDLQLELFLACLACFVKAEHITKLSPRALRELVLEDHMLLPSKDVYVGQEADTFRSQNPKHALLVPFLASVRKAYITTAVYLQKKLPLNSPTLIALSALDPLLRGHSQATLQLKRLSAMLNHLLPEDQDLSRELVQFSVDLTLPRYKEGDGMVDWWGHVFHQPGKYPALSALAKCCLSIFHGPRVESSFSLMNEIIDQRSGNMNVETFNAIQTAKYVLQSRGQTAVQMFERSDVKFGESLGESFSLQDVVNDGPSPEEEVVHPERPDPGEAEEAYHSDVEAHGIALDDDLSHITLTSENFSLSGLCEKLCVLLKFFTVQ
ncbi:hypothetical protein MHYP_G00194370 [Metynnis hypsauchen]